MLNISIPVLKSEGWTRLSSPDDEGEPGRYIR